MKMTRHAQIDREDRINWIVDFLKGDFGTVVCQTPRDNHDINILYSSGVVVVKSETTGRLITMFFASPERVKSLLKVHGQSCSTAMYKRICANYTIFSKIFFKRA